MTELSQFYQTIKDEALRFNYQFRITVTNLPTFAGSDRLNNLQFYARGATLPGPTIEAAELQFLATTFRMPNNLTFAGTLEMSVLCDSAMKNREAMVEWTEVFADLQKSGGGLKTIPLARLKLDLLNQNLDESPIATYTIEGAWPSAVGDMEFGHDNTDVSEFGTTFTYQYYWKDKGEGSQNTGDPLASGPTA